MSAKHIALPNAGAARRLPQQDVKGMGAGEGNNLAEIQNGHRKQKVNFSSLDQDQDRVEAFRETRSLLAALAIRHTEKTQTLSDAERSLQEHPAMSETLARENLGTERGRQRERSVQLAPVRGRIKSALAHIDENLQQRPLPTIALALALGFVAARLAVAR